MDSGAWCATDHGVTKSRTQRVTELTDASFWLLFFECGYTKIQ